MTRSEGRDPTDPNGLGEAIERVYDDVFDLLVESEDYLSRDVTKSDTGAPGGRRAACDRAFVISQKMRLTTRLSAAMAWLMMWRAVDEGEVAFDAPVIETVDPFDMAKCCLDTAAHADSRISRPLRDLLERSYKLYVRVVEMDTALRADPALAH